MLLVATPRFEPRSTGVRAIVAGLQVRAAAPTVTSDYGTDTSRSGFESGCCHQQHCGSGFDLTMVGNWCWLVLMCHPCVQWAQYALRNVLWSLTHDSFHVTSFIWINVVFLNFWIPLHDLLLRNEVLEYYLTALHALNVWSCTISFPQVP